MAYVRTHVRRSKNGRPHMVRAHKRWEPELEPGEQGIAQKQYPTGWVWMIRKRYGLFGPESVSIKAQPGTSEKDKARAWKEILEAQGD